MAAVVAWLFVRRGADADLRGDVNELSTLVERIAKADRRERMSRVRRGEKATDAGEAFPVPPGAEALAADAAVTPFNSKQELRRRLMSFRGTA